LLKQTLQNGNI
jgi:hypothetical protein